MAGDWGNIFTSVLAGKFYEGITQEAKQSDYHNRSKILLICLNLSSLCLNVIVQIVDGVYVC